MKITPTSLLTTGAKVLINYVIGAFMLVNLAVIGTYSYEAYQNHQQYEAIGQPEPLRMHKFSGTQFVTNPQGAFSYCVAVTRGNEVKYLNVSDQFCESMYNRMNSWVATAPNKSPTSVVESAFWGIVFFALFGVGMFLLVSIPANLIGGMFTGLARYSNIAAILLTLAIVVPFWTMFVINAVNPHPSYWMTPDGYVVNTMQVFMDKDGQLYKAPDNLFGWTSTQTMEKVSK